MYSSPEPLSVTSLNIDIWIKFLTDSAIDDGSWVVEGLKHRFLLGISSASTISAKRNCPSAYEHPEIINNYLQEELQDPWLGPSPRHLFRICRSIVLELFTSLHHENLGSLQTYLFQKKEPLTT